MTDEIFYRSIAVAKYLKSKGAQQGELNLAGVGESTMHPKFIEYLAHARAELGEDHQIMFTTNGLLVDDAMAQAMAPYRPGVFVSLHRPEKAGPAIEALKRAGITILGASADPSLSAVDWAGQVKWHVSAERTQCPWVRGGWMMVLADGRLVRCCFDTKPIAPIGHIMDDIQPYTAPYVLCKSCHQDVGFPIPETLEEAAA
jgi:hypothetical protein